MWNLNICDIIKNIATKHLSNSYITPTLSDIHNAKPKLGKNKIRNGKFDVHFTLSLPSAA